MKGFQNRPVRHSRCAAVADRIKYVIIESLSLRSFLTSNEQTY